MKAIGLDVGTTTVSLVILDERKSVISKTTVEHNSDLPGESFEKIQNPEVIFQIAEQCLNKVLPEYDDIQCIGITGQMHGVLYLDNEGNALSPLFTWLDGRGDREYRGGKTYAEYLSEKIGYKLSTGYGIVTHFYNAENGLVPEKAAVFCTIPDYVAMRLTGRIKPVTDVTNAMSVGVFDAQKGEFDYGTLEKIGINPQMLPDVSTNTIIGKTKDGIPVCLPIGDNQASFMGAGCGRTDRPVINIGTGSQISVYTDEYTSVTRLDTRPYPNGGWLVVGASLCGGKSYAMLESFIRESAHMVTGDDTPAYDTMSKLMEDSIEPDDCPRFVTTFSGTRENPSESGSISNINTDNFTPLHFMYGIMYGMAEELYDMYRQMLDAGFKKADVMTGSGNGLRKNKYLCKVVEKVFGCEVKASPDDEEAACGAAITAINTLAQ